VDKSLLNTYYQLKDLMTPKNNYLQLRSTLHTVDPPCMPYLGEPAAFQKNENTLPGHSPSPRLSLSFFFFFSFFFPGPLGVFLKDLTFIEQGNPDFVSTDEGVPAGSTRSLINFKKFRLIAKTIGEVQQYQTVQYAMRRLDALHAFLLDPPCRDDDDLYNLSLVIEPRSTLAPEEGTEGIAFSFFLFFFLLIDL
jgi:hypothetical protein